MLILVITGKLISQSSQIAPCLGNCGTSDVCVQNNTGHDVYLCIYPISMTFNAADKYNLVSTNPATAQQSNIFYYANGGAGYYCNVFANTYTLTRFWLCHTQQGVKLDYFNSGHTGMGKIGFGKYKVEIWHYNTINPPNVDSCLIDFDYFDSSNPPGDLAIVITGIGNMYYQFCNGFSEPVNLNYSEPKYYAIESWRPDGPDRIPYRNKNYGPGGNGYFNYNQEGSGSSYYNYSDIPLDPRRDCNKSLLYPFPFNSTYQFQNHQFPFKCDDPEINADDERIGDITLNLSIQQTPVSTRPYNWMKDSNYAALFPQLPPIIVEPYASLKFADGTTQNPIILNLTLIPSNSFYSDFFMTVKSYANLILGQNTTININNRNHLILECNSNLYCSTNGGNPSIINVNNGGTLCNVGAYKSGSLHIHYSQGITRAACLYCEPTSPSYGDSTTVILDSNAVLQIPDSTNIVFDGPNANLEMSPTSSIQFGQNSKLTLQNGAHICAQNCSFQSDSTGNPWDGLYLSGENDTITNCSIINSYNGINILNKNGNIGFNPITTQISSCTFSNITNTQLSTGIYISNSNNVLVNNNSFSSSPLAEGWASAILMQYCPAGNLDILDNTIKNVTIGISVIQSSPYIERNIINGQSDGTGIILDCCNGTLKYNTVNNFSEALVTYYSSDYFFRNNLNYSANDIVDLYQSSAPIIRPIYSGSSLMWLGGNNNFNGNSQGPSGYGIGLNDGSSPAIDSGFNNIVLNGANYMSGDLSQTGVLPATYNFWQDRPPVDSKFAVINGSVNYTPDYDGGSIPPINGYQLTDIGFGYYDTVCTSGSGDSPGADNLYIQAYTNEASHNYKSAISLYQQLVSTYKTSKLVPAALSRIINCMEKKTSTTTEYSQL